MKQFQHIDINENVRLDVRDWGKGKPIVFIPGWPFGHEMFEYQFTTLPQHGYRCIGISMRGFGKSSKPWCSYNYDVFADDLKSALDTIDLSEVTLVGFSMGGAIALNYMARHLGAHVTNLVLCGAAAPSFTVKTGFPFGMESGKVDAFLELCYSDRAKLTAEFCKIFFRSEDSASPQITSWFHSLAMEASPYATAASLIAMRDADLRKTINAVTIPTVVFHGWHDKICRFELAEALAAPGEEFAAGSEAITTEGKAAAGGIRDARLIRFENSGHALFFEEKNRFNSELINFIEKKESREKEYFPL